MNNREECRCRFFIFIFLFIIIALNILSKIRDRAFYSNTDAGKGDKTRILDILTDTLATCFLSSCLLDVRNENGTIE